MNLDRRWFVVLSSVGLLATPVFLFLLAVIAGAECAGPCNRPFWTPYLLGGLLVAGRVSLIVGTIGLAAVGVRYLQQGIGGD